MKNIYRMMALILAGVLIFVLPMQVAAWRNTGSYPVTLDNSNNDCRYPAMYNIGTQYRSTEVVAWQQWDPSNSNWDIYFRWGDKTTWAPATPYKVTNNGLWSNNNNNCERPDICANIDWEEEPWFTVYIAWQYINPNSGVYEIASCRIIIDLSGGWPGVISTIGYGQVSSYDYSHSILPAIDCGENAYIAWEDYRYGRAEIFFDWSMDGMTWYADTYWSSNGLNGNSMDPCIAVDQRGGGDPQYEKVCVLWEDYTTVNPQIWYHIYYMGPIPRPENVGQVPNGGNGNNEINPDIEDFSNEFLYVWEDDRDGNNEIYYGKTRFDGAANPLYWTNPPLRVTNDANSDSNPTIDVCENNFDPQNVFNEIHISWDSSRTGVRDIYACRGVQNPGGADTLSCSGQGGTDNRVSFTNNIDDFSDISCYSNEGYCVWEQNASPWDILYTIDP